MLKSIISEGKTTNEAIENGLKELKVTKNMVDIKVLENEEKRSFFNILAPRVVKVELTVKENNKNINNETKKTVSEEKKEERVIDLKDLEIAKTNVEEFLKDFLNKFKDQQFNQKVEIKDQNIEITIDGEDSGFLIGYRGETLNALQSILSSIANKNNNSKIRVILDIENYRDKRRGVLEALAVKVSKTVSRTGKPITLEPMGAYERKIIHTRLQGNKYVTTHSIGEEPNRRIVISKK